MRRFLVLALLALGACSAAAQSKIGHFNSEAIMQALPEAIDAQKSLDALVAQWETELQKMQADWKKKFDEYDKRKLILTDQARADQERGEAALAMGATRWQLVVRVLLPAARNGLLAAVLLGVGRAVGETKAVLMATGHAVQIPHGLLDSVRTLTANIAAELGEAPAGSAHYRVLFLTGIQLFILTFVVNIAADFAIRGVRRK